jgi:calmodulin
MSSRKRTLQREDTTSVLKEDLVKDFVSAFQLFSGRKERLSPEDIRMVIKQFDLKFTASQIDEMIKEGDTTGAGSLDSTEFMIMMARKLKQLDPRPTLQKAFEVFDAKKTGKIKLEDLYATLTETGDKLKHTDVDEMLKACKDKDGYFLYNDFLEVVYGMQAGDK